MTEIYSIEKFNKVLAIGDYAWPGGYPLFFVWSDGNVMSMESARKETDDILYMFEDGKFAYQDINWEDQDLTCDWSGDEIEPAYEIESDEV